jgi:hypothetical protein
MRVRVFNIIKLRAKVNTPVDRVILIYTSREERLRLQSNSLELKLNSKNKVHRSFYIMFGRFYRRMSFDSGIVSLETNGQMITGTAHVRGCTILEIIA